MDSVGVGELPDARAYGDEGSNTLGNIARQVRLNIPTLAALGLSRVRHAAVCAGAGASAGGFRTNGGAIGGQRLRHRPLGADGARDRSGVPDLSARLSRRSCASVRAAHRHAESSATSSRPARRSSTSSAPSTSRTGFPIVYTSADSVFQIAAHEDVVPVPQLYEWCGIAYELTVEGLGLGRVIARPFIGEPGSFTRTANRHDYAMPPRGETLLDRLTAAGVHVCAVGKIKDLFAGRGIAESYPTVSDDDGMTRVGAGDGAPGARADLRQSRGLRHAVRSPQRHAPATPPISSASTRGSRSCFRSCAPAICSWSRPITATIRRRRARIIRASTCRCCVAGARRAQRCRPRHARDVRRPRRRRWPTASASAPLEFGTSFLPDIRVLP